MNVEQSENHETEFQLTNISEELNNTIEEAE